MNYHPGLNDGPKTSHNLFMTECALASQHGWERYWALERMARVLMVAQTIATSMVAAMRAWDIREEAKKKT